MQLIKARPSHISILVLLIRNTNVSGAYEKTIRATQERSTLVLVLITILLLILLFYAKDNQTNFRKNLLMNARKFNSNTGLNRYEILRKKATNKLRLLAQEKDLLQAQLLVIIMT